MKETRTAFCPGHVTAFFEICDQPSEPLRKGSRGAGLSLSLGAKSKVTVEESAKQTIDIQVNGAKSEARTTRDAISELIRQRKLRIAVETSLDLPIGQGFAMSAAGALSSCHALSSLLDFSVQRTFEAVHIAEIKNHTGLGDVSGIMAGGAEIRLKPGLPPHGVVERIEAASQVVLAVVGEPIQTKNVITDPVKKKKISEAGKRCVDEFAENRTLEHMFALGVEFLEDSELFSKEVLEALVIADQHGMATMAMLGNALFCIGDTEELVPALSSLGKVYTCEIDQKGPRII